MPKFNSKTSKKNNLIDLEKLSSLIDEVVNLIRQDQSVISDKYMSAEINCKVLEKNKLNLSQFTIRIFE